MTRKIIAAEVARRAGVSVSAVSRAFRASSSLSEDKRRRILAVARTLGYVTPSGRSLADLTHGTVSLVVGDLANPFYPTVIDLLAKALAARDRRLILHVIPPGGAIDQVMGQVLDYRSDAVIVTSATMSSALARECRLQQMPVILFNRVQPDQGMTAVTCDNYGGGRLVAARLLALGRRRIAYIGGVENTSTHLERSNGFIDGLTAGGVALSGHVSGRFSYRESLVAAGGLFARPDPPDAVFCCNDVMALAAMDAARTRGLRVPDDVAIIGFDDIPMAGWPSYRLTTVRQPVNLMVRDALDLIDGQIADGSVAGAIRIAPVRLIERDSG